MNISPPSVVPPAAQDRLITFFATMEQREQEIREAALAVEYCNVFGEYPVTTEQCTNAIQALGSLATTIHQHQQCFFGFSVPILAVELREAAQSPWRLVLEMIDEAIVQLASLRVVLPIVEARDLQLRRDIFDQHHELLKAIAESFRNGARWRDRVRFESLRFVRLRDTARHRQTIRRRRWN